MGVAVTMVKINQPFRRPQVLRKGTHIKGINRVLPQISQRSRTPPTLPKIGYIVDRRKETIKVFNLLGQVVHNHQRNHRPRISSEEYKAVDSIVTCFIVYDNLRRYLIKWDNDFDGASILLKTIANDIHSVIPTLKSMILSKRFPSRKAQADDLIFMVNALGFGEDIATDVQRIVASSARIVAVFNQFLKETRNGKEASYHPPEETYKSLQAIFQRAISKEEIDNIVQFLETGTLKDIEKEAREVYARRSRRAGMVFLLLFELMFIACGPGSNSQYTKQLPKYETSWVMAPSPLHSNLYEISYRGLYNPYKSSQGDFDHALPCEGPDGKDLIVHDAIQIEKEGGVNFAVDGNGNHVSVADTLSYENLNIIVTEFGKRLEVIRARNITDQTEEAKTIMQAIWQLLEEKGRLYDTEATLTIGTSPNDTLRVDCDMGSLIYISIGQAYHLPIFLVIVPTHAFVRWDSDHPDVAQYGFPKGIRFNWETTEEDREIGNKVWSDEELGAEFALTKRQLSGGSYYMKSLGRNQVVSLLYWNLAAFYYDNHSSYDSALQYINQSIELDPQNSAAYELKGLILLRLAREVHQEAIGFVLSQPEAKLGKAKSDSIKIEYSRRLTELYPEARQNFQRALELDPNLATAYIGIADTYLGQFDYPKAIENYSTAIGIGGDFTYKFLFRRGSAYLDYAQRRTGEALVDSLLRNAIHDFSESLAIIQRDSLYNADPDFDYYNEALMAHNKAKKTLREYGRR